MADFPALIPSLRTLSPGAVAQSQFRAYGGQESRAQLGAGVHGHSVSLSFSALTFAEAKSIRDHYLGQQGSLVPFDLPADVWSGFSAYASILPGGYQWIYAGPPQFSEVACTIQSATVQLVAVFNFAETGFVPAAYDDDLTPTTDLWDPADSEMCSIVPEESTPTDPSFANVSLLLHMDGANDSTTFVDSSGYARDVTAEGNAKISTVSSVFGNASGYFDGASDYLSMDPSAELAPGSGNFTFECWVTPSSLRTAGVFQLGSGFPTSTSTGRLAIATNSNGTWAAYAKNTSNSSSGSHMYVGGTTYHVALVRNSATTTLYVDGSTAIQFFGDTTNYADNVLGIGGVQDTSRYWLGYIDEFRVTKGVARYTADFTPPAAPFPDA